MKLAPLFFTTLFLLTAGACMQQQDDLTPDRSETPAFKAAKDAVPGIIRIKFKEEPYLDSTGKILSPTLGQCTFTRTFPPAGKWESRHRAAGLHLWYDVAFDPILPLTKARMAMVDLDNVAIVEYIPQVKSLAMDPPFNDPQLPKQWHYQNFGDGAQLAEGCDVNAYRAWAIETGKPEVIVAVNDIGVDYQHEDLAANMWVNEAEYYGLPGEDDDNNGYIDDIYGYNFITYDGLNPIGKIDPGDHGTHVAGTIAAVNNNGIGVGGVAGGDGTPRSGVRIMVDQTLDERKNGSFTPDSFVYAADNGAVLMNCSWGFTNNEIPTPQSYVEAINYFNQYAGLDEEGNQVGPMIGGLMIFAAGNDGREVEHPAMDDNVFAVAALSANYIRSYFTSFGEWVDICAPGGDANRGTFILSTLPNNGYGNMQGSSMAAPHVTGVAALIVSHYGVGHKGFTRDKLIYLLQSTANKKALEENGSYATRLGAGLVDAYAALIAESPTGVPSPVTDLKANARSNFVSLEWSVPDSKDVPLPYSFHVYYSTDPLTDLDPGNLPENVSTLEILSRGNPVGTKLTTIIDNLDFETTYHIRIASVSLMGEASPLSPEIDITTSINAKPVITPLEDTMIVLHSHENGELRFRISDSDGHPLTFGLTEQMKGVSLAQDGDSIVVISINARNAGPGTYEGTLWLSDSYEAIEQSFTIHILTNTPPRAIGTVEDQIFSGLSETRTFDLSKLFKDDDGETLTYQVSSSSTSIVVDAQIQDESFSITSHSFGMTTLTLTASDEAQASASISFRVLVRNGDGKTEVYPNPFADFLYIRTGAQQSIPIKMVSSLGSVVFDSTVVASPFDPAKLDFQSLSSGVYSLLIGDDINPVIFTVVKQ